MGGGGRNSAGELSRNGFQFAAAAFGGFTPGQSHMPVRTELVRGTSDLSALAVEGAGI